MRNHVAFRITLPCGCCRLARSRSGGLVAQRAVVEEHVNKGRRWVGRPLGRTFQKLVLAKNRNPMSDRMYNAANARPERPPLENGLKLCLLMFINPILSKPRRSAAASPAICSALFFRAEQFDSRARSGSRMGLQKIQHSRSAYTLAKRTDPPR